MEKRYDLAVIGAGPGGYVAAIRGAQLKQKVVLIERDKVGGTCMNWGCIPTKFLLHQTKFFHALQKNQQMAQMMEGPLAQIRCNWQQVQAEKEKRVMRLIKGIEFLIKKNGIDLIQGEAYLKSEKNKIEILEQKLDKKYTIYAKKIILATGSRPAELPMLTTDAQNVITSREALELQEIPVKLLVVGAGSIGLEMGTIYNRLGSEVIILELMEQILPGSDSEVAKRLQRLLKGSGMQIFTQMRIEEKSIRDSQVTLKGTCLRDNSAFEYTADKVLVAAGRRPVQIGGLESISINVDKIGFVEVNPQLETSYPGVYAIGDLIGGALLAHKASHEGIIAAENASGAGAKKAMSYQALPHAVFTDPEFASVGMTEQDAREKLPNVKVGVFSLQANGRALTMGEQEGIVKVVADNQEKVVGAHILSPHASEFIPEMTLAIEKELHLKDIASLIHIHPTLSEAVMEAAMKARNEAIHMLNNPT